MNLLVDIGNSCIKWVQQSGRDLRYYDGRLYKAADLVELLKKNWRGLTRPTKVCVSNVAGDKVAADMSLVVNELWEREPIFLSVQQEYAGVTNAYDDYEQLGVDRWLAMIAAWNRHQTAVCVIDCGTAVTVDVVTASGNHLGGYIVPGLGLMSDVLNRETKQIDSVRNSSSALELGRNTAECISNGALMTITSLIFQVFDKVRLEQDKNCKCIITGGFAREIVGFLGADVEHDPYLVLGGIAMMSGKL
jgi:type III pantothenate kinase